MIGVGGVDSSCYNCVVNCIARDCTLLFMPASIVPTLLCVPSRFGGGLGEVWGGNNKTKFIPGTQQKEPLHKTTSRNNINQNTAI